MFSDTFAGIRPSSVPLFLLAQAAGGALGYLSARTLHPTARTGIRTVQPAEEQL